MVAKNGFDLLLALNYFKVTKLWCNSNSTCRATYWMYIPGFKLISQSMLKKSPENVDGRTDWQTDGHCHGIIRPFFKRAYKNGNDNVGLSPSVIYNGCMEISHVQDILYVIRAFLRTKALIPMVITSFVIPSEYIVNIGYEDSLQKGDFTSYPKIPQYHIWKPDITHTSFLSPHM